MYAYARIKKPVQRQNARRHITRIASAYRRHVTEGGIHTPARGLAVAARTEVLGAFEAHRVCSWRAMQPRMEA